MKHWKYYDSKQLQWNGEGLVRIQSEFLHENDFVKRERSWNKCKRMNESQIHEFQAKYFDWQSKTGRGKIAIFMQNGKYSKSQSLIHVSTFPKVWPNAVKPLIKIWDPMILWFEETL